MEGGEQESLADHFELEFSKYLPVTRCFGVCLKIHLRLKRWEDLFGTLTESFLS